MARNEKDFSVPVGTTFQPTLRWGTGVYSAKAITGISASTPAVVTAVGHGVPNGWPCAVVGALGMVEINATRYPPQGTDWHNANVLGVDTVQFNDVGSELFTPWTSGGHLVFDTPADLSTYTFSLAIYADANRTGTPLVTLTSSPAAGITVDNTLKTIVPLLQTAGLTWTTGYYRLDATTGAGVVTEILRGAINIQ